MSYVAPFIVVVLFCQGDRRTVRDQHRADGNGHQRGELSDHTAVEA